MDKDFVIGIPIRDFDQPMTRLSKNLSNVTFLMNFAPFSPFFGVVRFAVVINAVTFENKLLILTVGLGLVVLV